MDSHVHQYKSHARILACRLHMGERSSMLMQDKSLSALSVAPEEAERWCL